MKSIKVNLSRFFFFGSPTKDLTETKNWLVKESQRFAKRNDFESVLIIDHDLRNIEQAQNTFQKRRRSAMRRFHQQ